MERQMPNHGKYDHNWHDYVYLTLSFLYLLDCLGFDKTVVAAGLAVCYYLRYRF